MTVFVCCGASITHFLLLSVLPVSDTGVELKPTALLQHTWGIFWQRTDTAPQEHFSSLCQILPCCSGSMWDVLVWLFLAGPLIWPLVVFVLVCSIVECFGMCTWFGNLVLTLLFVVQLIMITCFVCAWKMFCVFGDLNGSSHSKTKTFCVQAACCLMLVFIEGCFPVTVQCLIHSSCLVITTQAYTWFMHFVVNWCAIHRFSFCFQLLHQNGLIIISLLGLTASKLYRQTCNHPMCTSNICGAHSRNSVH